jgi:hypothetical protein
MNETMIYVRFVDVDTAKTLALKEIFHVPRKGDMVRLRGGAEGGKVFKVMVVRWNYHDLDEPHGKVYIGIKRQDLKK